MAHKGTECRDARKAFTRPQKGWKHRGQEVREATVISTMEGIWVIHRDPKSDAAPVEPPASLLAYSSPALLVSGLRFTPFLSLLFDLGDKNVQLLKLSAQEKQRSCAVDQNPAASQMTKRLMSPHTHLVVQKFPKKSSQGHIKSWINISCRTRGKKTPGNQL